MHIHPFILAILGATNFRVLSGNINKFWVVKNKR